MMYICMSLLIFVQSQLLVLVEEISTNDTKISRPFFFPARLVENEKVLIEWTLNE